ncbi:ABC transporter permease [Roseicyclus mahoneyensis]|uniref:Putative spermidine/putrescine transport system permease protein n=1 Tax=Roseicyclus mahoneyensis TaxID=164332 RepID=A0A316GMI1_9RHOB|nr:ABC transporter permease [Roseicyclus mahoneyensis]PWK60612.1 putative spermidine/putrescine transport system permease protein [Roseicyclus mahoneyensis]
MSDATAGNLSQAAAEARREDAAQTGPMLAADGRPLKRSLNRALRAQKLRALALIAPLLIFLLVTFVAPILDMLFRSVENQIVSETLPRTVIALDGWDATDLPDDATYAALAHDFKEAAERRIHTRLGSRLNYEATGLSSIFRRSGRGIDGVGEPYADQFAALDPAWEEPATWIALMADPDWISEQADWLEAAQDTPEPAFRLVPGIADVLPETTDAYRSFARTIQTTGRTPESPLTKEPWATVYLALYRDLSGATGADIGAYSGPGATRLQTAADAVAGFETIPLRDAFAEVADGWVQMPVWTTIQTFSDPYTAGYFLAAVDLQLTPQGIEQVEDNQRIYLTLFKRTMVLSLTIMGLCVILGYPIAYLLSNLPMRTSNMLLILVLLPFWTSLLVRTSAWKVLLQQQGVINDLLVWIGLVGDDARLTMINNQTGTVVAMTHILLPFMILPLYSVMKTIPPSYVRAAKSLGATNWTAFWRVYFPQSVPGIGAGCILVFILSIGYYITPEIVGGRTGIFISNRIAFHISDSLNWGLAAALGSILLALVLVLYWLYDKIVGIDNVKLG